MPGRDGPGMHKAVIGLNRRDGLSFEEFREYWLDEHAPLASEMPGLERYTVAFADDPDRAAYDGVAEVYFADAEALREGMGSETGQAATEDVGNFADADGMLYLVTEEHVVVD